jgi:hypothetical protein
VQKSDLTADKRHANDFSCCLNVSQYHAVANVGAERVKGLERQLARASLSRPVEESLPRVTRKDRR